MSAVAGDRIRLVKHCQTSQGHFPIGSEGFVMAAAKHLGDLWTLQMDYGLTLRTSDTTRFEVLPGQAYGHGPATGLPLTVSLKSGDRVRTTKDYPHWPKGITGVVKSCNNANLSVTVDLDDGRTTQFPVQDLEVYVQQFATHYQAQPIMDEADTDDDHDYTPAPQEEESSSLSGDELMDITRSFCRGY